MSVRASMFLHVLKRGLLGRGNRPLIAFIALTVAATMITAMLSLYGGLENKLNRDFRSYGANITVAAPDGQRLPPDALTRAHSAIGSDAIVVPFAFAIAHTSGDEAVVVAGTEMDQVRRLNAWWSVSKWPSGDDQALAGSRAESHLQVNHGSFDLDFAGRSLHFRQSGTVKTGSDEEDRVYIPLSTFERWTGIGASLLEISAPGSRDQIAADVSQLESALPGMQVRPVRQLLRAQGAVVSRMRSVMLASTLLIALTVALCVFSTLTSSILERRRDFAVMKAIGSSQATVNALFAGEALTIALCAAVLGYILGSGTAAWISQANFHAVVTPQLSVLPLVILANLALALLAATVPLARLQRIEPAGILKGE
ncbi:MAG TPA: FtsX-like permease family protein [Terriglobales bacterium]|jgi:putative ABC transport system permease protein|nr:FtsX-like permease family protein [Terriglobales bacterium]